MRKLYFVVLAAFCAGISQAQKLPKTKSCYTAIYLQHLQQQNPKAEKTADFEKAMSNKIQQRRADPKQNSITTYNALPIIFHILTVGESVGTGYNIPQELVVAQVIQLNKDYENLSGSPYPVASRTGIQFCLAQKDTNGNVLAEPGIDRINTLNQSFNQPPYTYDYVESTVKAATIWDPKKYINVWVTEFDATEGILGYSTFPSLSTLDGLDDTEADTTAGVVLDYNTVGSVGTASAVCDPVNTYVNGRTLTHELGHYFGLRHIWGDGLCATDYCDDTPVHADANFGSPTHPKPNTCGTADEMFENYMDYTDDRVMNTFTLNQVERMQVVMLNSPRRTVLSTSNAGCGRSTSGAKKIGFFPCDGTVSISEKSMLRTCPQYTDVTLYISIEDKASGPATLTFNTSGTATNGIDYDILTPVIKIAAGDAFKQVTVRVYDDAAKEDDETILLSYSISGDGVVANASLPQTFTINILDNDKVTVGQNTKTLLSQDFGTSGNSLPSGWSVLSAPGFPSAKNKFLVGSGVSAFSGQSLYISNNPTSRANVYSTSSRSGSIAQTASIDPAGSSTINLSFKYQVAGEIDGNGTWDYGLVLTSPSSARTQYTTVPNAPVLVGTKAANSTKTVSSTVNVVLPSQVGKSPFRVSFFWQNDNNTGYQPPLAVDDILITGTPTKVESDSGHSATVSVNAGDSNFIVSDNDNQIIASISKASDNIKCVNAVIQQAGTGQVDITTSTGTYKRSQKVIRLTPVNESTASYSVTLYYTTAELAGWPSITNLKVLKVQNGLSLTSTLTQANSVLLTPVIADYRSSDGYASFTVNATGFSQFFLVSANTTLPVQLLSFNAGIAGSGASLVWTTTNEVTNKGFNIQRSTDGQNFSNIGFAAGKNAELNGSYSWFDNKIQPGIIYYYRLEQVDINGKTSFSAIRTVQLTGENLQIIAFPNPARSYTHVVTGKNTVATLTLLTAGGQKVWELSSQSISAAGFDVPLQNLAAGVYILWVQDDKTRKKVKIIKE